MSKISSKAEHKKNTLVPLSSFYFEGERLGVGMSIIFGGVIGISEYTEELVCLTTHRGRIKVFGKKLVLNVYENKSCEIQGRVEEIFFGYVKS